MEIITTIGRQSEIGLIARLCKDDYHRDCRQLALARHVNYITHVAHVSRFTRFSGRSLFGEVIRPSNMSSSGDDGDE
jgi:hypothetical protein